MRHRQHRFFLRTQRACGIALGRRRPSNFGVMLALVLASFFAFMGCGGGGGGGGAAETFEVEDELTFLLNDGGPEPRTGHRLRFRLQDTDPPGVLLRSDDIEVRRNGAVDTEARVRINPRTIDKDPVTLILDVSSSLTPTDFSELKASAKEFAESIVNSAQSLSIIYFSSPSQTQFVREYMPMPDGLGGFVWNSDPGIDIEAIQSGANSTALYFAVKTAIDRFSDDQDRGKRIFVVFSDGKENSSPPSVREETVDLIADQELIVWTVGFGDVDESELRELTIPEGRYFGVHASLGELFSEIAAAIRGQYTIIYDSPVVFGSQRLDIRFDTGRRIHRHLTSFDGGVDLARSTYGRYPTMPGSRVVLTDFSGEEPEERIYTVQALDQGIAGSSEGVADVFLFAIDPTHACPGIECIRKYQGPYGEGSVSQSGQVYFPAVLDTEESWTDAETGEEFRFTGLDNIVFFRGTPDQRRITCARVESNGTLRWFAREIGLVRTESSDGTLLLDLAEPPCLSSTFDGSCSPS